MEEKIFATPLRDGFYLFIHCNFTRGLQYRLNPNQSSPTDLTCNVLAHIISIDEKSLQHTQARAAELDLNTLLAFSPFSHVSYSPLVDQLSPPSSGKT